MKKLIIFLVIVIVYFVSMIYLNHKEANMKLPILSFQISYEDSIEIYSLKSEWLNKYIDSLEACYDENFFYDKKNDFTVMKFKTISKKHYYKHVLELKKENYCNEEFSLEENYVTKVLKYSEILGFEVKSCAFKNDKEECKYSRDSYNIEELMTVLKNQSEIKVTNRVSEDPKNEYVISIYYELNNSTFVLNIFKTNKRLTVQVIDEDDHKKYVQYELTGEAQKIIKQILNNVETQP